MINLEELAKDCIKQPYNMLDKIKDSLKEKLKGIDDEIANLLGDPKEIINSIDTRSSNITLKENAYTLIKNVLRDGLLDNIFDNCIKKEDLYQIYNERIKIFNYDVFKNKLNNMILSYINKNLSMKDIYKLKIIDYVSEYVNNKMNEINISLNKLKLDIDLRMINHILNRTLSIEERIDIENFVKSYQNDNPCQIPESLLQYKDLINEFKNAYNIAKEHFNKKTGMYT